MYPLFMIAKNNLKKKKGDVLVLFLLTVLAVLMLYSSISVLSGTGRVLDTAYEKHHTADLFYITNAKNWEKVEEIYTAQEEVAEYEKSECLYVLDTKYRRSHTEEPKEFPFVLGAAEDERKISRLENEQAAHAAYDDIYLPYYLKAAEGYEIDDSIYLSFGEKEYQFRVAGFVEDPNLATPLNISLYSAYISRDRMEDMVEENASLKAARSYCFKVRLKQGERSYDFEEKISPLLTKGVPELAQTVNMGANWEAMQGGVAMMSNISMSIILAFSLLIIVVILVIIRFSIRNFLEANIKNIGILQASGYRARQLRIVSMMEMGLVAAAGIISGLCLGLGGSRLIGSFQGVMLGMSWNQGFDKRAAIFTVAAVFFMIEGVSFFTGRLYHKITVLDALRGGIHTHNFKRNYFPLEKSSLPLSLVLSGKQIFGEKMKSISILFIAAILSFSTCVSFAMVENFAMSTDTIMQLTGVEISDIGITGENLEGVAEEIRTWDEVKSMLLYSTCIVRLESEEGQASITCDIWEEPDKLHNEILLEGRLPKYENEIVLTTNVAERLDVEVGDVIYVEAMGERLDYVVSGIDQKINNMGLKTMMNMEGAERLNGTGRATILYVYTEPGVSYEDMESRMADAYPEYKVMDGASLAEGTIGGLKVAFTAICTLFVAVTVFAVILVEVLLIKSRIVRERRNYGVSKALGYTTGSLCRQTMMGNLPVIEAGSIAGVVLSALLKEPLAVACLSFSGIKECSLTTSFFWSVITVAGILFVAAFVSLLSALRIRKIEPVRMLAEE